MELTAKLILWVHLSSLLLAGCATFAAPLVARMMAQADAAQRPVFGPILAKLSALGRMALVLLVLSGLGLIWVKYGGFAGQNGWFHLKLTLVVILCALVIFNIFNTRWAQAGNAAAAARHPALMKAVTLLVLATILAAVFAFN